MPPAKIMVVEDEIVVAMELQTRLIDLGYMVSGIAAGAEEAVELAAKTLPDLVLMDVKLTGEMDGIDAARDIREHHNIPVVYLTAHADARTLQRAKLTYPLGYIVKPFSEEDLRASIEVALFRHGEETRLREDSEFFAATLDILGGAVILADGDGIIRSMSPVAESLTGWTRAEAIGKHLSEVYVLRDEETGRIVEDPLSIMHLKSEFVPVSSKYVLISRNAVPIPVVNTLMGTRDSGGRISGIIAAFQDSSQMIMPEQFWSSYAANLQLSGILLRAQGHYSRAESCFRRALLIWERNLGKDHPKVARALEALAEVCQMSGRREEARELQTKAAAIRAGVPESSSS
ncbi:MAG: response regulator [Desulfomonilaceae bacterium]|nr:response regulator [Desulfomonilaceae bacterium]